jgi:hypothetical protein
MARMMSRVTAASAMFAGSPKLGVLAPPPAQPNDTGSSDIPITVITTPVTTGGKRCRSRLNTGASRKPTTPATRTAP